MNLFKTSPNNGLAKPPERATKYSVGYDLVATDNGMEIGNCLIYDTGIYLNKIPDNMFAMLAPRSSIFKTDLRLANSVGIIDPDYRDSIKVIFDMNPTVSIGDLKRYRTGDKIAQIIIMAYYIEPLEFDVTAIRRGGFGSTDSDKPSFSIKEKVESKPKSGKKVK